MSKDRALKLAEVASRINAHLQRMEKAQSIPETGYRRAYHMASASDARSRVAVRYICYQHTYNLTKAEAVKYLAWLDAGNEGKHYTALSFNTLIQNVNKERAAS